MKIAHLFNLEAQSFLKPILGNASNNEVKRADYTYSVDFFDSFYEDFCKISRSGPIASVWPLDECLFLNHCS
jgi:hypothetical protein